MNEKAKKIFFDLTFLCTINNINLKKVFDFCLENGREIVKNAEEAQAIIIDSCIFIPANIKKTKAKIRTFFKKYPNKKLIVVGCGAGEDKLRKKFKTVYFVGVKELSLLDDILESEISISKTINKPGKRFFDLAPDKNLLERLYSSVNCIISRGCLGKCSYCNTKKAIGYPKSKSIREIVCEIKGSMVSGKENIELLSDDCSGYGSDIGTDIFELTEKLFREFKKSKISITHISPPFFLRFFQQFESLLASKRIGALSLTMQSTSSRIIRLMNRNYDPMEFLDKIKQIKESYPHVKLTTHLLVCFPTETRREFMDTIRAAEYFDRVILNIYQRIPGTLASKLKQLSRKEVEKRKKLIKQTADPRRVTIGTD